MINSLHVENFTVFKKADFDFVPGVNVLVGGNATGKTHVLKLLYAMQKTQAEIGRGFRTYIVPNADGPQRIMSLPDRLEGVFRCERLRNLIKRASTLQTARLRLMQHCYMPGPHRQPWPSDFAVGIFNLKEWNERLAPHSVRRTP